MVEPKQLSPEWWQNKEVSHPWCDAFCREFFEADPSLKNDPETYASVGIIFINRPNGDIVPVGITAVQDGNFIFQYHSSYLANPNFNAISDTLPKRAERFTAHGAMLPYFDNLPAEGWFGKAQSEALGHQKNSRKLNAESKHMDAEPLEARYHRFMMFGRDYPGAVWATYIHNDPEIVAEHHQHMIEAALRSRSSIAGVQPKLLGVEDSTGAIHPASYWETSTHIVKLPPLDPMPGLMEYEYMSTVATKALLPSDTVVDAKLTNLHLRNGDKKPVLAIKRFDRTGVEDGKVHFEEMNQLMGKHNAERYVGAYADIAAIIEAKMGHAGVQQFYARLMSQFLLGNTDNHCKNFAMFHGFEDDEWKLTPDYDLAPTVNYQKSELALFATRHRTTSVGGGPNESKELYANLNAKLLVMLGEEFGLSLPEIKQTIDGVVANIPAAKQAVMDDPSPRLDQHATSKKTYREDFCDRMDGRARNLFGTLDKYLAYRAERAPSAQRGRG